MLYGLFLNNNIIILKITHITYGLYGLWVILLFKNNPYNILIGSGLVLPAL